MHQCARVYLDVCAHNYVCIYFLALSERLEKQRPLMVMSAHHTHISLVSHTFVYQNNPALIKAAADSGLGTC